MTQIEGKPLCEIGHCLIRGWGVLMLAQVVWGKLFQGN